MKKLLIFLMLFSFFTKAKSQTPEQYAEEIRQKYKIPAIGYAVIKSDSILILNVIGTKQHDKEQKATTTDRFHIGSNTKALTGFVAAILVEQNKIKWNTKFFDLFPDLKASTKTAYSEITLQDLLSHRAGIQPFTDGNEFNQLPGFKGTLTEQRIEFAKWLLQQEPVKEFKKKEVAYSNAGYAIAAVMLEKVSNKSWEELVREYIEDKLKIKIAFGFPNKTDENQPWGHWKEDGKLVSTPPSHPYHLNPLIAPAGDISMTLEDYAKFIQLNLQGLRGKAKVLSPETFRFLHFGLKKYAIGWGSDSILGLKISFHDGSAGSFYTHTMIDDYKDLAVVIFSNSGDENAVEGINKLERFLFKKYMK